MFRGVIQQVHFVGIGGSGMSGIAEVLINLGFKVTGSDLNSSVAVDRLNKLGATITIGHHPNNIAHSDVLVKSTAIPNHNVEIQAAIEQRIPIIPRAEMLAELMRMKYGIAVAGTHGKTTTTSMLGAILFKAGIDPTIVIGGKLDALGSSARLGEGEFLVAEADESDGSFLCLSPTVGIITNIDPEHLEHWGTEDNLIKGFVNFANKVPFFGFAVLCLDHPTVQQIVPRIHRRLITYGFGAQATLRADQIRQNGIETTFRLHRKDQYLGDIQLNMPGKHNIQNALAAAAVSLELGISFEKIQAALHGFTGVDRRFSVRAQGKLSSEDVLDIIVIDDYGHHPVEIQSTLQGASSAWPERRIIAVFQPHRYTRIRDLFDDFCRSFYSAHTVVVCPIYKAGEKPIEGIDHHALAQQMRAFGHSNIRLCEGIEQLPELISSFWHPGDLILTLGAGNVNQCCAHLGQLLND